MCFSQSSPGWTLTESALFSKRPVYSPRTLDPETGRSRGEGGKDGGRKEGENYFGFISPEAQKNKQITYRYYANMYLLHMSKIRGEVRIADECAQRGGGAGEVQLPPGLKQLLESQ